MDKTLVVFACLCGFAVAQFGGFGQSSNPDLSRNQNQQSRYQNQPKQPFQEAPKANFAGACNELNERYPVAGSCDSYIECINGTAEEKQCPDGLRFNPDAVGYPCQYPNEYACLERSSLQPAQPTDQCEHQFGFYKLGDRSNCSYFRSCVAGIAYDFQCPEGLAWSSASYRCDWPDEVEDCDAEAFLGFRCPEVPISKELGAPAGFRFYRAENNCQKYFLCIGTKPRVLICGKNTAYDELTSTCVSADEVDACPVEIRTEAARAREEAQRLLAKELEFNAKTTDKKRYH